MFVRSALNREPSNSRRETVLDGRLPPGSTLPEATIDARHVLRALALVVLVDRQDEAWTPPSETESTSWYRSERGAMAADVDAKIVFIRERSPAGRCATESRVAEAIVRHERAG